MKIAYITAGAAGMYCGTCLHDNTLAAALIERGHEVSLTPTYTPMRTDETSVAIDQVFFGAINVYLQQKLKLFRRTPRFVDRLFDNKRLLNWVSRFAGSTNAHELGALTLSMLEGEEGAQAKELDKLVEWLEEILQPEIVHLSHTLFLGFARRIKERLGVPVVVSLQGEDLFFEELVEPWHRGVRRVVAERAGDVDAFVAPSRYYADTMAEEYGLPKERIHRLRLGIKASDFEHAEPSTPAEISADAPVTLGYLARFCPEKGIDILLEAFEQLVAEPGGERLRLRIAGYLGEKDRVFYERQEERIASGPMAGRVELVGEVDRQGKIDFLRSLDIFTMPTVYREPKGLPVLEALASGVPVVQPRHGSFPEMVDDTGGGILVEPCSPRALAQGLRELIDDPERRRALATAGRRSVLERYDEGTMAEETLALYRQLLGRGEPG